GVGVHIGQAFSETDLASHTHDRGRPLAIFELLAQTNGGDEHLQGFSVGHLTLRHETSIRVAVDDLGIDGVVDVPTGPATDVRVITELGGQVPKAFGYPFHVECAHHNGRELLTGQFTVR